MRCVGEAEAKAEATVAGVDVQRRLRVAVAAAIAVATLGLCGGRHDERELARAARLALQLRHERERVSREPESRLTQRLAMAAAAAGGGGRHSASTGSGGWFTNTTQKIGNSGWSVNALFCRSYSLRGVWYSKLRYEPPLLTIHRN